MTKAEDIRRVVWVDLGDLDEASDRRPLFYYRNVLLAGMNSFIPTYSCQRLVKRGYLVQRFRGGSYKYCLTEEARRILTTPDEEAE